MRSLPIKITDEDYQTLKELRFKYDLSFAEILRRALALLKKMVDKGDDVLERGR